MFHFQLLQCTLCPWNCIYMKITFYRIIFHHVFSVILQTGWLNVKWTDSLLCCCLLCSHSPSARIRTSDSGVVTWDDLSPVAMVNRSIGAPLMMAFYSRHTRLTQSEQTQTQISCSGTENSECPVSAQSSGSDSALWSRTVFYDCFHQFFVDCCRPTLNVSCFQVSWKRDRPDYIKIKINKYCLPAFNIDCKTTISSLGFKVSLLVWSF